MKKEPLTMYDVKKHIRSCKRYKKKYDWLGFVEGQELTPEVESLFSAGIGWWDWVKGNEKLKELIKETR